MKKSIKNQIDNLNNHLALIKQDHKIYFTKKDRTEQKKQALKAAKKYREIITKITINNSMEVDIYMIGIGFWSNVEYVSKNLLCLKCNSEFNCDCKF